MSCATGTRRIKHSHSILAQDLIIKQIVGKKGYSIELILFYNFNNLSNHIQNSISKYLEFNLDEQI